QVAQLVRAGRQDVQSRVAQLVERNRLLEKELERIKEKLASAAGSDLAAGAVRIGSVNVLAAALEGVDPKSLREAMDRLKDRLGSAVIVLGTAADGKVSLVAGVTKDQVKTVKAGDLVKYVAEQVGGRGGGRPDMAQAGGNDPAALPAALASVEAWVRQRLGG
ncbi:MAG: alanine--tRNA ligase, partial [Gammaproteobacteria bacterium]|nr:alanine--tRNA ligase [Gammaproteobacteria bacterium]